MPAWLRCLREPLDPDGPFASGGISIHCVHESGLVCCSLLLSKAGSEQY